MDKQQLDALEALHGKATQGEWRCFDAWGPHTDGLMRVQRIGSHEATGLCRDDGGDIIGISADFELIVRMRNALPALLAIAREHEQTQRDLAAAREEVAALQSVVRNTVYATHVGGCPVAYVMWQEDADVRERMPDDVSRAALDRALDIPPTPGAQR